MGLSRVRKQPKAESSSNSQSFLTNSASTAPKSLSNIFPDRFKPPFLQCLCSGFILPNSGFFPRFFLLCLLLLCISKLCAEYNKVMDVANKEFSKEVKHLNFNSGGLQGLLLSDILLSEITVSC